MRLPAHLLAAPLFAALIVAACKSPPPPAPLDVLDVVPGSASAVVYGTGLLEASSSVLALLGSVDGSSKDHPSTVAADVKVRVGFDPFSREGITAAGLKPDGPFAMAILGEGATWLLPVQDEALAMTTMAALAKTLEQADKEHDEVVDGMKLRRFARPFGSREVPVLAVAMHQGFLVVGRGPDGAAHVVQVLKGTKLTSLAASPMAKRASGSVPGTPLRFMVDTSRAGEVAKDAAAAGRVVQLVAGGLTPSAGGAQLELSAMLDPARAAAVTGALFPPGPPLPLAALMEPDAVAVGQGTLLLDALRTVLKDVDATADAKLAAQVNRLGLEAEESLLHMTDGHFAGALYLAAPADIAAAFRAGEQLQRQLLRFFPFVVAMRPRTGHTAQELVDHITSRVKARGMAVAALSGEPNAFQATVVGGPAWRSYQMAVVDGVLLVGGGSETRFRSALRRVRDKATSNNLEPVAMEQLARGDASSLLVRLPVVAARLDEVLKEDLGEGADGLTVKSLIQRAKGFAMRARDLWFSLENRAGAVHANVRVRLGNAVP